MIRDILRAVGIGCLLAGGILYFNIDGNALADNDTKQLQGEVEKLQNELAKMKELLANAQTTSAVEKNSPETAKEQAEEEEDDITESNPPSSDATTTTILTIESGSNSTVVSANLERLGVIEDAALFDSYLKDNNLAAKLQVGDHNVISTMDFETIAKEITTRKK